MASWRDRHVDRNPRHGQLQTHFGIASARAASAPHFGYGKTLALRIRSSGPTPSIHGTFEIEAAARDRVTRSTVVATAQYTLLSNATGRPATVIETSHPLVLLYSAPPCEAGSRMKVRFQSADGFTQDTPYKPASAV